MNRHLPIEFCNDQETEILSTFENELTIGSDGWAMIAPFGDFDGVASMANDAGAQRQFMAVQRVDRQAAQKMVDHFKSPFQKLKRFLRGLPIFHGHPDSPSIGHRYTDKASKGVLSDLQVRDNGLYGLPVFTNEGAELVESRRARAFSARWSSDFVSDEGGKKVYRPSILHSVGLTSNPNLPVEWLNEKESAAPRGDGHNQHKDPNIMNKDKLLALLKKHGVEMANDATDEQIEAALDKLGTEAKAKAELNNELDTTKAERDVLKEKVKNTATELETKKVELNNERKARIGMLLDQALADGRITPAQRPEWAGKLEADFANESAALSKLTATVKTKSSVDLSSRKADLSNVRERRDQVQALVEVEMKNGLDYDSAWRRVQSTHPKLFESMQQPASV